MKLSYPEAERMGFDYEDVYLLAFSELDYVVSELQRVHNNDGINDIPSYILNFIKKMLETWESIFLIYSHNQDYVSVYTLCRTIVDNLATIYHIYMTPNKDEKEFRHYLYVLDGINNRLKYSKEPSEIINDGRITDAEFSALMAQIEDTLAADKAVRNFILTQLKNSPLYQNNEILNNIIQSANWRYESLTSFSKKSGRKNQLSWNFLYSKIGSNSVFANFISYLSVFVHGLSISNIKLRKDAELFEPMLSLSIATLDMTLKAVKCIYKEDLEHYNIDIKNSPIGIALLQSVSTEYLKGLADKIKEHTT